MHDVWHPHRSHATAPHFAGLSKNGDLVSQPFPKIFVTVQVLFWRLPAWQVAQSAWVGSCVTSCSTRSSGGVRRVSRRFRPCFRAVSSMVRSAAWFRAPASLRKLPEIFCCTLRGRSARSAALLVAGTAGSRVNRSTPSRLSRSRRARLWPRRRFRRPRRPFAGGGGRASCVAMPAVTMPS